MAPTAFRPSGYAVLLACAGVAVALGAAAFSAPASGPTFAEPKEYRVGNNPDGLVSGDLNDDGRVDLVTANGSAISVTTVRRRGTPAWAKCWCSARPASIRNSRPSRCPRLIS